MILDKVLLIISSWDGYQEAKKRILDCETTFGSINYAWHKRTLPILLQKLKPSIIMIDNHVFGSESKEIENVAIEITETLNVKTKIFHFNSRTPQDAKEGKVFHIKEAENLFEHVN